MINIYDYYHQCSIISLKEQHFSEVFVFGQ